MTEKLKNMILIESQNYCKGVIYKCYENTYLSSYGSIESRKSLRILKSKSCPGCESCEWERDFIREDISNGLLKINNCKDGKLYKLNLHMVQGYEDFYPEVVYSEFIEVKK